jgi:hypothetical protein
MKKVFTAVALSATLFIAACGGGSDKPAEAPAVANPGKMNDFIAILDGTDGSSKKAADTYFSDSLKNSQAESNNLTFTNYIMKDAKVVSVEGQCCTMEAKAGVTTRSFKLCWQGDKVTGIEDLGIK